MKQGTISIIERKLEELRDARRETQRLLRQLELLLRTAR